MTKHQSESERKAQILTAARDVFVARGYADARVEDVAKKAGLSKGAVYFYFPSKRDLFMALVLAEHEATYRFLEEAEQLDLPAVAKLLQVGRSYLSWHAGLNQPPRFFLMMTELALRDDEIRSECQALHQRFVDAVARVLAQGVAEGTFRNIDPVTTSLLLKATIDGFGGHAAIGVAPERTRFAAEVFRTVMRGVLVEPDLAEAVAEGVAMALADVDATPSVEAVPANG